MLIKRIFIVVISAFIGLNIFQFFKDDFCRGEKRISPVGYQFIALKPWLSHYAYAGFYKPSPSKDVVIDANFAYAYQSAQFVLSPTLLDYEQPFIYNALIAQVGGSDYAHILRTFHPTFIMQFSDNIFLFQR